MYYCSGSQTYSLPSDVSSAAFCAAPPVLARPPQAPAPPTYYCRLTPSQAPNLVPLACQAGTLSANFRTCVDSSNSTVGVPRHAACSAGSPLRRGTGVPGHDTPAGMSRPLTSAAAFSLLLLHPTPPHPTLPHSSM
jgi:hypothetical protein